MQFKSDAKVQPELVASKDKSRPALTKVHLDADKAQVVVTDSYMLARFPVDLDEGDTSGPIPVDALKASRKAPNSYAGPVSIRANSHVEVVQDGEPYVTLPREPLDYQFPDADRLIPDNLATFEIGLSAEKLLALAKSLGADKGSGYGVRLRFVAHTETGEPQPLRPIRVDAINAHGRDGEPDGLLMPIRIAY